MSNFHWTHYATLAKNIAKRINDGTEVNKEGVRLDAIRDKQDIYATDALNRVYANKGSKASIHTYWGGAQEISTQHADGSKGLFRTGERSQPTNNEMDREVENYMNNSIKESTNMKHTIKLKESQLRQIVKESIKSVLKEEWDFPDEMGYSVIDELEELSNENVDHNNPESIVDAYRKIVRNESNTDIERLLAIGNDLLTKNGLTEGDEQRCLEATKQEFEQARNRIQAIMNWAKKHKQN